MDTPIHVDTITSKRDLRKFVTFPWIVYANDSNWVPPLISDQIEALDPERGPFYKRGEIGLFLAHRNHQVVGTIAAYIDNHRVEHLGKQDGNFGFFEVVSDYDTAKRLLDAATDWLTIRGMTQMTGPFNLSNSDHAGILIGGADCPPVMMEAHTPPYYQQFLEKYGLQKDHDLYAYRAFRSQIGEGLKNIPPELKRAADFAKRAANVEIRKVNIDDWENEIKIAHDLFNTTLSHMPEHVPMTEGDFVRLANRMRPFLDPDLAFFAEIEGKVIGFCVALPDINQILIHLNGRLFPFNWLKIRHLLREVSVVSFKMMGVMEEYRRRGIDALLYLEVMKNVFNKGYAWFDGSLTSESNLMVNRIATRMGAERYKHFRVYNLQL